MTTLREAAQQALNTNQRKENAMDKITINGIEYAPVNKPTGTRAVVVVDRGWIFAGDVTRENGRIRLSRALHVFKWESIGFAKMVETAEADLRPIADVDIPSGAEIFCVPVRDDWGM
jgi:hypothetical protein